MKISEAIGLIFLFAVATFFVTKCEINDIADKRSENKRLFGQCVHGKYKDIKDLDAVKELCYIEVEATTGRSRYY